MNQSILKSAERQVKISFQEFKRIEFEPFELPSVVIDLVEYLTGYSIMEFARVQSEK